MSGIFYKSERLAVKLASLFFVFLFAYLIFYS